MYPLLLIKIIVLSEDVLLLRRRSCGAGADNML